jgi:hypothetical protein
MRTVHLDAYGTRAPSSRETGRPGVAGASYGSFARSRPDRARSRCGAASGPVHKVGRWVAETELLTGLATPTVTAREQAPGCDRASRR